MALHSYSYFLYIQKRAMKYWNIHNYYPGVCARHKPLCDGQLHHQASDLHICGSHLLSQTCCCLCQVKATETMSDVLMCCDIDLHGFLTRYAKCRKRFPRHRLQMEPLVCDPVIHHGTGVTHMPWCKSGSLTRGGVESVPRFPGVCAIRNFAYLVRGLLLIWRECQQQNDKLEVYSLS